MTKTMFTLQILHGENFVQGEQVTYVNGDEYISTIDSDFMSYFELIDIMKDIGYPNHPIVYYKLPNSDMNTDLVKLTSDAEIVHMMRMLGVTYTEWHDDMQIDSDKEAFSGMEESSTDDEEELGDKEVGDNVGDNEEWAGRPKKERAGRPKKNRKKAEDKPKNLIRVRKHYTSLRCGKCKEVGHNSRTCQKIPHEAGKGKQPMQTMSQGSGKGKIVPNKPMGSMLDHHSRTK
ncbi:hypothetical protein Acr_11g0010590 [Actinidia rufa]|uniref:PB1-like domain-containing protein n=1 Tax=Actinidia rufa TaxID=165716 RepID=A0A7J0FDU0_9ERIC|nr:hypothetical protein Acr_11g0010590 [Actinidia rufa]